MVAQAWASDLGRAGHACRLALSLEESREVAHSCSLASFTAGREAGCGVVCSHSGSSTRLAVSSRVSR